MNKKIIENYNKETNKIENQKMDQKYISNYTDWESKLTKKAPSLKILKNEFIYIYFFFKPKIKKIFSTINMRYGTSTHVHNI